MKNISNIIRDATINTVTYVDGLHPNYWIVYNSGMIEMFGWKLYNDIVSAVNP